ncbi:hypothetical protein [Rhodovulum adriaticum]|uniref:Uncharacterized protein n=1 Tax=Rhodovulum adriaticum TaxID=35804 RepID=A0A4R2NNH9_RHOAD|nr:hypothetical protein [Rhodovulum adriaticum]MBK1634395.1 hypothetical protein [Rhodovulum adriaticum]TCP23237.1 hypothetical protein EV656_104212 [Rhodovulum adriaticum]
MSIRAFLLAVTVTFAAGGAGAQAAATAGTDQATALRSLYGSHLIKAACCKVCRKGKACGDTCISRSYTCRKPPGCACDG